MSRPPVAEPVGEPSPRADPSRESDGSAPARGKGVADAAARLSVAPMMDRTDRHYRFFMRRLTRRTLLYSEMITTPALRFGDVDRLLGFSDPERPLALQLGGDDPAELAHCARVAQQRGYDEINLNVGCPSDRVAAGNFGACLMAQPELVARCVQAMGEVVDIPVTVKHRIGTDKLDRYEDLECFVDTVAAAGCTRFIVHARIAVLGGLSPKQNRTVPPLRYADVYRLKQRFPALTIVINGGITNLHQVAQQLHQVDGVMVGRAAYEDPFSFAAADQQLYGESAPVASRADVIAAMIPYLEQLEQQGEPAHRVTRHMFGLFAGRPGARAWRRMLGTDPGAAALAQSLTSLPSQVLEELPHPIAP